MLAQNTSKFRIILSGRRHLNRKVQTEDRVADIFTKTLAKGKFKMFKEALKVVDRMHALRGSVKN